AAQPQRRAELEGPALAARRPVPALLRPALHAGGRRRVRERQEPLRAGLRPGQLRARPDAPPPRRPGRLLLALGPDRDDRIPRRPERLHERVGRRLLLQLRLLAAPGVQVVTDHPVDRPAGCAVNRPVGLAAWLAAAAVAATGCMDDVDPPW